jgi:hypothetical protein
VHDQKTGLWTYGYENGLRQSMGRYLEGTPEGVWSWWYENGRLAEEGSFSAGSEDGPWRRWHQNGRLAEQGEWAAGQRRGWWVEWDDAGAEIQRLRYEGGAVAEVQVPPPQPAPPVAVRCQAGADCNGDGAPVRVYPGITVYSHDPWFYYPWWGLGGSYVYGHGGHRAFHPPRHHQEGHRPGGDGGGGHGPFIKIPSRGSRGRR